jgi:hypothetical protein
MAVAEQFLHQGRSNLNEDSALMELPNHLWALKSYVVGSEIGDDDKRLVSAGWVYIQRLSTQFTAVYRPTQAQFGEAVEFLREFVQDASNEYWSQVKTAVVMYVDHHFVKPVSTTDAKTIEYESSINTMAQACRRIRVSMTRDRSSRWWKNWYHLYQLLKGLWEDKPGNQLSPKNFVYTYLKKKRVKSPNISRTELASIDRDFLKSIYPEKEYRPNQSPLHTRVAFSRNKKLYERIKKHTAKVTGLAFMIDKPRGNKEFQKQEPYHVWKEVEGTKLFYLYDQKIGDIAGAATVQRKRDQVDDEEETGSRLRIEMSDKGELRENIKVMQSAFNGTPSRKMLVEMIEELHGRGAMLDFIKKRPTRTREEEQAMMGMSYEQDMDNLRYLPANEIEYAMEDQRTHDPSTLTGSNHETIEDTMAIEGMLNMRNGSPDYSQFNDNVLGLEDMELSPAKTIIETEDGAGCKHDTEEKNLVENVMTRGKEITGTSSRTKENYCEKAGGEESTGGGGGGREREADTNNPPRNETDGERNRGSQHYGGRE